MESTAHGLHQREIWVGIRPGPLGGDRLFTDYIDFEPKVVFEVGVGKQCQVRSKPYWVKCKCCLFEPLPKYYHSLHKKQKRFRRIQLFQVAIWKEDGVVEFNVVDQGSFVKGLNSPELQNNGAENCRNVIEVQARTIDHYDAGNIDILLLDIEGAEIYALERLKSRPKFISVETHLEGVYTNPFLQEIEEWMTREGYEAVGVENADTYYKRTT